jgi:hypothetical protein
MRPPAIIGRKMGRERAVFCNHSPQFKADDNRPRLQGGRPAELMRVVELHLQQSGEIELGRLQQVDLPAARQDIERPVKPRAGLRGGQAPAQEALITGCAFAPPRLGAAAPPGYRVSERIAVPEPPVAGQALRPGRPAGSARLHGAPRRGTASARGRAAPGAVLHSACALPRPGCPRRQRSAGRPNELWNSLGWRPARSRMPASRHQACLANWKAVRLSSACNPR